MREFIAFLGLLFTLPAFLIYAIIVIAMYVFHRTDPRLGGKARSPGWNEFRKKYIKQFCEFCGIRGSLLTRLELHHVLPFHLFPEKELDPENVVTGCRKCHLDFFHLGSFSSYNKDIKKDIEEWKNKVANRP